MVFSARNTCTRWKRIIISTEYPTNNPDKPLQTRSSNSQKSQRLRYFDTHIVSTPRTSPNCAALMSAGKEIHHEANFKEHRFIICDLNYPN